MSRIKGKNTKPEMVVRSLLHRMGYRFRLHAKNLPGSRMRNAFARQSLPNLWSMPNHRVSLVCNMADRKNSLQTLSLIRHGRGILKRAGAQTQPTCKRFEQRIEDRFVRNR